LNTLAKKENGHYLINGRKWFTTAADGASFAIVMAVTNPDAENLGNSNDMVYAKIPVSDFLCVTNINGLTNTIQNSVLTYDANTGLLYYTASSTFAVNNYYTSSITQSITSSTVNNNINNSTINQTIISSSVNNVAPSNQYIQYNSASAFGASADFQFVYSLSSLQQGNTTSAQGQYSHAEGKATYALGISSHAEGDSSTSKGDWSHAEGRLTTASGSYSHAEGNFNIASGYASHTEGAFTQATEQYSHWSKSRRLKHRGNGKCVCGQ
jgi:hypothetical protein